MKKLRYFVVVLIGILMLPMTVLATEVEPISASTEIDLFYFYGDGCPFCTQLEEFFTNLDEEYQSMINIIRFEVWQSEINSNLMRRVANHLGVESQGVPFFVIGEETFNGYSPEMDEDIKRAIREEFESEERYRGVAELINNSDAEESDSIVDSSDLIIALVAIAIIGGVVALIIFARKK